MAQEAGAGRSKQHAGKGLAARAKQQRAGRRRTSHRRCASRQGARGPRKALRRAAQRSRSFTAKGFYPVRHEDLHAPGPRMKINQPKCMCRASQGKGGMRGTCADAKISLGDAFLYGP